MVAFFSQVMNFARWMAMGAMELCHLRSRSHAMPCVFISGRATQGNSVLQRSTWRYKTTEQSTSFWPGVCTHLYNIEDSTRKDTLGKYESDIALWGDETSCLAFLFLRLDAGWVLNCSYAMKEGEWWHHFINIRGPIKFLGELLEASRQIFANVSCCRCKKYFDYSNSLVKSSL